MTKLLPYFHQLLGQIFEVIHPPLYSFLQQLIKGERSAKREEGTSKLLTELDAEGPKYERFGNVIELQKEVRSALVKLLKDRFGIAPMVRLNYHLKIEERL